MSTPQELRWKREKTSGKNRELGYHERRISDLEASLSALLVKWGAESPDDIDALRRRLEVELAVFFPSENPFPEITSS